MLSIGKIRNTCESFMLFADCILRHTYQFKTANFVFREIDKKVEFYQKIEKLIEYLAISGKK